MGHQCIWSLYIKITVPFYPQQKWQRIPLVCQPLLTVPSSQAWWAAPEILLPLCPPSITQDLFSESPQEGKAFISFTTQSSSPLGRGPGTNRRMCQIGKERMGSGELYSLKGGKHIRKDQKPSSERHTFKKKSQQLCSQYILPLVLQGHDS